MASFTQFQLDALKEVGSISAGNAATAFSQMIGKRVGMSVPQLNVLPAQELKEVFQGNEVKIGLYQKILGQAGGSMLMVLSRPSAFGLIELVLPERSGKPKILKASDEDLLKELANIVSGAYLTTLAKMTNLFFMPSVPHLTIDLTRLMVEHLLQTNAQLDRALVVLNELRVEDTTIDFQLILLPDPETLPLILKSVGATS